MVHDESTIVRACQLAIRRELDRRGMSMKALAFDSGMPSSTLQSYFPADPNAAPHVMSVAALRQLIGAIPDDVLSLLLPDDRLIVKVPEGIDHTTLARLATDYIRAKLESHPDDTDHAELDRAAMRLVGAAA